MARTVLFKTWCENEWAWRLRLQQRESLEHMPEYSPAYAQSTAKNELYYLDTNRSAEERPAQVAFNKGFAARNALLGVSATVNTEISLIEQVLIFRETNWSIIAQLETRNQLVIDSDDCGWLQIDHHKIATDRAPIVIQQWGTKIIHEWVFWITEDGRNWVKTSRQATVLSNDYRVDLQNTVESRFLEPPGETQIGSRRWHQITFNWPGIVWLWVSVQILTKLHPL